MHATPAIKTFVERHQTRLFWLHSAYCMAIGIAMMWLGARHYGYLRIALFHISFIWISSLFLPYVARIPRWTPLWAERVRLLINYFNRNFYQQFLYFILPLYYASTTLFSANMFFLLTLAATTILATLDVVYDRYLTRQWLILAIFFSFNLFACAYAMLPMLWGIPYNLVIKLCAAAAAIAFISFCWQLSQWPKRRKIFACAASLVLLGAIAQWGAPFLPPVPLRLVSTISGSGFDPANRAISGQSACISTATSHRVYIETAIVAPVGLQDQLRHRWILAGKTIYQSPLFTVAGGRKEGFRLHTSWTLKPGHSGKPLRIDVVNECGQLVGRYTTTLQ